MAEKGKSKTKPAAKGGGSRRGRMLLAALAVIMILAAVVVSFWLVKSFLFSHNTHFILRDVKVSSSGWWNGRTTKVREFLDLQNNDINLFKLKLDELRKKLENHPSIRKAEVDRILPDTLSVKIYERIPRAYLNDRNSRWVIDDTGIIMDRESSIRMDNGLPVILGLDKKQEISAGMTMPDLLPIVNLLMLTITDFPDVRITNVSVNNPKMLTVILYYHGIDKRYIAYIPANRINTAADTREMLFRLRCNIDNALRTGSQKNVIYLGYSGMGVMR